MTGASDNAARIWTYLFMMRAPLHRLDGLRVDARHGHERLAALSRAVALDAPALQHEDLELNCSRGARGQLKLACRNAALDVVGDGFEAHVALAPARRRLDRVDRERTEPRQREFHAAELVDHRLSHIRSAHRLDGERRQRGSDRQRSQASNILAHDVLLFLDCWFTST